MEVILGSRPSAAGRSGAWGKVYICVCAHTQTMTKTVGLSDDAYERLVAVKAPGESFSEVVRRLTGAHLLLRLVGTMDDATAEIYRKALRAGRARRDRRRDARIRKFVERRSR